MQTAAKPLPRFSFNAPPHLLIIEARFHEDISDLLMEGAIRACEAAGATYERIAVPGSLEIPTVIAYAVRSLNYSVVRRRFDGYVALGCIIEGDTRHHEIVGDLSAEGLQRLALDHALAIGNGILTCQNRDQALERARIDGQDKGGGAAVAALRLIEIKQDFKLHAPRRRWVAQK